MHEDKLKKLQIFSEDEILLREYFLRNQAAGNQSYNTLNAYLLTVNKPYLPIYTPLNKREIGAYLYEEDFIPNSHDIALYKHLRYSPAMFHASEFFHVYCNLYGETTIHLEDETIQLRAGDYLILPPEISHAVSVFSDTTVLINWLIRGTTFHYRFSDIFDHQDILSTFFIQAIFANSNKIPYLLFHSGNNAEITNVVYYSYAEFNSKRVKKERNLNSLFSILLINLLRQNDDNLLAIRNGEDQTLNKKALALLMYIRSNYSSTSLKLVAEHFNYSQKQVSRIIKQYTGQSFTELITQCRISKAKELLLQTDFSILHISEIVGYKNATYFYKLFKKHEGITPKEFREQAQEC